MRDYFISTIWLIALFLFAYPSLIIAAFDSTKVFGDIYVKEQCTSLNIFTNCGYLALTFFDYFISDSKKLEMRKIVTISSINLVLIFVMGGLANLLKNGDVKNYYVLKDYPNMIYWIHFAYLLILLYIKKVSINISNFHNEPIKKITEV